MTSPGDDRVLIERIARGDREALKDIYGRHHMRIYRFLVRMTGNEGMAEDIMNEVFLAAWQGASRYEGRSAPLTWLLSIAHNKAASRMRKRQAATALLDAAADVADLADTPDIVAQKEDKGRLIRQCMDALSSEHRTIVDLVYYQERSVAEAAEILGIPEGTVKTRMFHARKKLSELLAARGVDRGWP
ncbi:sigma-70 family RNA polymerase sigma factor [Hyphomicrobium sp.]|uniref:sigma-70 family RNA polymerase sigma factor n=1 Tax=Hyphomicrobium sp. TaxID=82 RepID=UPI0025BF81BF|nr:sigma-70 family RNA polymerase sigma factor [Hyphomicrobium sp.]MCC7250966.1 sigma-70 family RNA polymerase sigma factor [Hyphomicrobium sp.]